MSRPWSKDGVERHNQWKYIEIEIENNGTIPSRVPSKSNEILLHLNDIHGRLKFFVMKNTQHKMSAALSLKKRSNRPLETLSAITESFSKFAFVFWTTKTTTKYIKTSSLSGAAACWMVTVETNGGSRTGGHVDSQGGSIPEPLCAVPRQEKQQQQRAGAMATPTPFSFPPLRILCSE